MHNYTTSRNINP